MTILVAGFSSFPGAPTNPCQALVASLRDSTGNLGTALETVVLPVEWDRSWPVLAAAIEASRPSAVLLFGLHARAERLRIEVEAANARELGREDAAGRYPSGPTVADGPERLVGRLPLAAIARNLRRDAVGFEISRDAGRYLCNDTYYRLCFDAGRLGLKHWGFVHTPLTDEALDDWIAAGALPPICRTVSAAGLRRAALSMVEALAAPVETA